MTQSELWTLLSNQTIMWHNINSVLPRIYHLPQLNKQTFTYTMQLELIACVIRMTVDITQSAVA